LVDFLPLRAVLRRPLIWVGRFNAQTVASKGHVHLDATQLAMLLDAIDIGRVRPAKHWQSPRKDQKRIDSVSHMRSTLSVTVPDDDAELEALIATLDPTSQVVVRIIQKSNAELKAMLAGLGEGELPDFVG